MAVTPSTLTELTDLAKDLYTNYYEPQMDMATPVKAQFDALENWEFAGRKIIFGLKLETGGGAVNITSNESLPENADGTYDQAETSPVRTYVRMALDMFDAEISKSKKGSFKPFLEEKMDDRMQAMNREINRQLFSAGDGKLAITPTGAASGTQTLSLAYGVTNGGSPAQYIYKGDYLAFYNASDVLIGRRKVTGKTATLGASTCTVTLLSTITSDTNGYVTKSNASDGDNVSSGEANGLLSGFVQSGNFQGVPVAGNYQATVLSNSGTLRDISDTTIMTGFTSAQALSGQVPNLIVTRPGIVQKYSEVFLPIRRIDGQTTPLKGGYKPVSVFQHASGEAPIITDVDCPGARLFGLCTKYLKKIDLVGTQWADFDGATLSRVQDKDAAEGYIRKFWQLAWQKLNCHFMVSDINDVSTAGRTHQ